MLSRATVLLAALAVCSLAQAKDDAAGHRAQLVSDLSAAMEPPSDPSARPLADRVAEAARDWAHDPKTARSDFSRLKSAVKTLRSLLSAPAATVETGEFAALAAQLSPMMGEDEASALVADLQSSMFRELMQLFAAARAGDSTPINGEPFFFRGRRYGWAMHEGDAIIVRWGSPLHASAGLLPDREEENATALAYGRASQGGGTGATNSSGSTAAGSTAAPGRGASPQGARGAPPAAHNGPINASQSDLEILARICKGEAVGCPPEGRVAVLAVLLNRVRSPRFPDTIAGVAHQPSQFSCYNPKYRQRLYYGPIPQVCWDAARAALEGQDPTGGATHYFNPYLVSPSWAKSMDFLGRIGNDRSDTHDFYKMR